MVENLTYIAWKRIELTRVSAATPRLRLREKWLAGPDPTKLQISIDLIARLSDSGVTIFLVELVLQLFIVSKKLPLIK
jgi:branched-chain amino acid transport system permease protein